jgi:hypothetical protein
LREDLVVVGRRGEQRADCDVYAARFLVRILPVSQVSLVNDLGQPHETAVAQPCPLDQRLERAVLALMTELYTGRVERNRVLRELRRRREDELRPRIDEALDQPCRRDAVYVGTGARDSPLTAKLGEIEDRPLFAAG